MGSCWKWVQLLQLLTAEDCHSSRKWLKALRKKVGCDKEQGGGEEGWLIGREIKENLTDMGQGVKNILNALF